MSDDAESAMPGQTVETRCSVAVFRGDDVLVIRSQEDGSPVWKLPGGHVRADEGLRACAARELREETGLEAAGLRCAFVLDVPDRDTGRYVVEIVLFPMGGVRGEPRTREAGHEPMFVPMAELPRLPLKPSIAGSLHDMRRLHERDLADEEYGSAAVFGP